MRRPWFQLEPCDEAFFDSAPLRKALTIEIAQPASAVWAELTGDKPLAWCRGLEITWTSPRPFGVDTRRTARVMRGALEIHERFFIWEEGRRKTFQVLEASAPLFKRFGEDYLVEAVSPESCRLTWVIAAEPSALGRLGAPLNNRLLEGFFRDTRRHYGVG